MSVDEGYDAAVAEAMEEAGFTTVTVDPEYEKVKSLERNRRQARREVDAEELFSAGSEAPVAQTRSQMLADRSGEAHWRIQDLLVAGGVVLLAAYRKAGKTTFVLNVARSMILGERLADMFEVDAYPGDRTVVWLDCELPKQTREEWVDAISGDAVDDPGEASAWERFVAIGARGRLHHFNITTADGRDRLKREILRHGKCGLFIADPVGPWMTACGLRDSNDLDVAIFLNHIKTVMVDTGILEVLLTHHVGKASHRDEGHESARGSSVWEAEVDAIIIAGRSSEDDGGKRWIRAEGRDVELAEHTVLMDEVTRKIEILGGNRHDNQARARALKALAVIVESPGIITSAIEGDVRIPGGSKARRNAAEMCVREGWAERVTGAHNAQQHHPTGEVPDDFVPFD